MPSVYEITEFVHTLAPPNLAEEWDNVGLLVDCGGDAQRVLLALDVTQAVVQEAEELRCGLIVAHHPVIFGSLKKVTHTDVVFRLIQKNISALCAHTNLDVAAGGVNDALAEVLGLQNCECLEPFGRIGYLPTPLSLQEFGKHCAQKLGKAVQLVGAEQTIQRVAVAGGSAKEAISAAVLAGAQCFVTGEAGHHTALDALQEGLSLVVAGHYATECPVLPVLAKKLQAQFPTIAVSISQRQQDPFVICPSIGCL